MQNPDGSLEELAVRADIDVWQHCFRLHWDNGLTPLAARSLADELDVAVGELSALASPCAQQPTRSTGGRHDDHHHERTDPR